MFKGTVVLRSEQNAKGIYGDDAESRTHGNNSVVSMPRPLLKYVLVSVIHSVIFISNI